MSAKKTPAKKQATKEPKQVTILLGLHRGQKGRVMPAKGLPAGKVSVNIEQGPTITIHQTLIK